MNRSKEAEHQMREYLLGQLPDERREELESLYFSDSEAFELLEATEDEMIQDFVSGSLPAKERKLLEQRWRTQPGKTRELKFARALGDHAKEAAFAPLRKSGLRWLPGSARLWVPALACLLVLATLVAIRWSNTHQQQANTTPKKETRPPRVESLAAVFSITLSPQLTRGFAGGSTFTVPPKTQEIQLVAEFPERHDLSQYSAAIRTPEGVSLWTGVAVIKTATEGKAQAVILVPASALPKGDMILTLSAVDARGQRQEIEDFSFRLI